MRQYQPDKPNKWGFKVFALCSSRSGLVHNFEMYTGRDNPPVAQIEEVRTNESLIVNNTSHGSLVNESQDASLFQNILADNVEYSILTTVKPTFSVESMNLELEHSQEVATEFFCQNNVSNLTQVIEPQSAIELPALLEFSTSSSIYNGAMCENQTIKSSTHASKSKIEITSLFSLFLIEIIEFLFLLLILFKRKTYE